MASFAGQRHFLKFGVFEIDLAAGEIRKAGMKLKLAPQPFQVLQVLLEHPHQVVTREELRQRVWPDNTFVDYELALKKAVNRLREVLGDSAENPRFIETVPRRGYRFIGALTSPSSTEENLSGAGDSRVPSPVSGTIAARARPTSVFAQWRVVTVLALLFVGGTTGLVVARWRRSPSVFKQRRLTANSQEAPVIGAVISPNGQYLAFADRTGFYLQQIANGETHLLSLPPGFNAVPIAWYPDGAHIVATWVEGPKSSSSLWQIPIMGGAPRKLTGDGAFASVPRSGSQISFLRGEGPHEELWVMGENGESPRRLFATTHRSVFGPPAWSPDEKRIALVTATQEPGRWEATMNIRLLDLSTGNQEVIVSPQATNPELDASAQFAWRIVWTADNRLVYAVTEPPPNQTDLNLWQVTLDSIGHVTGGALRLTASPGGISNLSASANSTQIVYTKSSETPTIYLSELRSDESGLSMPRRLTVDDWRDIAFAWTPDSKAVIFVSDRDGVFHIFKQPVDQTVAERLVGGSEQANIPRLAPDNSSLLYLAWPKVGGSATPTRLMRMPLAGGPPQEVLRDYRIGNIQCARPPSTVCLYHVETGTGLSFFRLDPVNGSSEMLSQFTVEDNAPQMYGWNLSPDGKILLTSKTEGVQKDPSFNLYSLEDGSRRTVTIKDWASFTGLDFAADGKSLWAGAYDNAGKWALLNISLQGQARTMLEGTEMIQWAIPAPDGKHLALEKLQLTSNVWMLERR